MKGSQICWSQHQERYDRFRIARLLLARVFACSSDLQLADFKKAIVSQLTLIRVGREGMSPINIEAVDRSLLQGQEPRRVLKKRLRYAAISVATVLKSFTLSRRISLMICFRPARYWSFSSGVLPLRRDPIWTRILSSANVNNTACQHPYIAN